MEPLAILTHRTFAERLGATFRVRDSEPPLELTLASVTATGDEEPTSGRRPFSIVFNGPLQPVLPQRIYRLEAAGIGALEIFIVPIGPAGDAMQYEAVFA